MPDNTMPPSMLSLWGQRKMLALALLGFSSGLPLFLTSRTLQAWMTVENVSLATVGAFSLVALPYSLKFLWAPFMDRYVPPFLGRRRGWLLITQALLLVAIAAMSLQNPRVGIQLLAINAIVIAFLSASQDIVVDAYRTDVLEEREMGAGAAIWVLGYRVALLVTASLALVLADHLPWTTVYLILSLLMLIGMAAAFWAPDPPQDARPPSSLRDAVILPFADFFQRKGARYAILILAFIVLYKLPDYMVAQMATPFLLKLGFSQTDIGAIQGGLGIAATIVGALVGGGVVARIGLYRSLWVFGILQAVSNLAYLVLALVGLDYGFLVGTILVENFCSGLASAGFVAFLMSLCSVRFSATQFALLSSLMGASRDVLVSPSGVIAEMTGWVLYFALSLVAAIPGMAMLHWFVRRETGERQVSG